MRNKNPHRNPRQIIAYVANSEYGTGDSQSFQVFPRESVANEDEESGSRQTVYADFDFAVCFLIASGGRLTLDYDENMALLRR